MASDKRLLSRLEDRLRDAGYVLRYEKGHFRAGYCLVHERRVVVVNKFFDPAARLQTLQGIVAELQLDLSAPDGSTESSSEAVNQVSTPESATA